MLKSSNSFLLSICSVTDGTQPSSTPGTTITPGNNTYGSYASVLAGASLTDDAYELDICINSNFVDATARDAIVTIGFDPAGGTSFGGLGGVSGNEINHLLASSAGNYFGTTGGPIWYRFPVFIKSGTSIGAKASVNNASVGTMKVFVTARCKPTRPDLMRVGAFVRTFGETTASSTGTSVTPGTAGDGTYVQLGSALAEPLWYWEVGMGINNSAITQNSHHLDVAVGDATTKQIVISNAWAGTIQTDIITKPIAGTFGGGSTGDLVYGRIQAGDNSPNSGYSMIAYGVGG